MVWDVAVGMARQGYDLQLTRYDEKGWRATFYATGMEHSPTSATGHRMGAHDIYRHLALPRFARVTRQDQVAVEGHGVGQEPPTVLKASLKSSASERK